MPIEKSKRQKDMPQEKIQRITSIANAVTSGRASSEDPQGSYTGLPLEPGEVPVQDADDL